MRRVAILFGLLIFLHGNYLLEAKAESPNFARVIAIEQVSKGPYAIGDIVTLKITYTSNVDAIRSGTIYGVRSPEACLMAGVGGIGNLDGHLQNSRFNQIVFGTNSLINSSPYITAGTFTAIINGIVLPCAFTKNDPLISLVDTKGKFFYANEREQWFNDDITKTNVVNSGLGNLVNQLKFSTKPNDLFVSQGEPKPIKIDDQIDLKNVPKNPKLKKSYLLPKFTNGGAPIFWEANSTVCTVEKKPFKEGLGGTLKIKALGNCKLNSLVMITDKFNLPGINANFEFIKQGDTGPFTALFVTKK
jgi:hypothetical protein